MHTMRGLALLSVFSLSLLARAVLWDVTPGNSIQEAVNQAANGDTVLIHDGLYTESVVLYGKTITLGSLMLMDGDTSHVIETMIEPDTTRPDTQSCIVYAYGEDPEGRLVGLSLVGGRGTLHYPEFPDALFGGGIYLDTSSVSVEWCRFEECEAAEGGGIWAMGFSQWNLSSYLTVRNCYFYDCEGTYVNGNMVSAGGGIRAWNCNFHVVNSVFEGDTCTGFGGAVDCSAFSQIDSCIFRNCQGLIEGGVSFGGTGGHIADCLFDGNTSSDTHFGHLGIAGTDVLVTRCVFRNCVSPGTSILSSGMRVRFVGNVVEGNVSTFAWGTYLNNNNIFYPGEIAYNVFRQNYSPTGGTIFNWSSERIHHNVFHDNSYDSTNGASAFIQIGLGHPTLDSNIFAGNSGNTFAFINDPRTIHAENNWWGHPSGPYHPTQNPGGQGDTLLSDSVLFIPWLTEAPDTTIPPDYLPVRELPEISRTWELVDVYPNPFNQVVTLVLAGFSGADFEIGLYNLLGQKVDAVRRGALTGGQVHYQAPPHLASGVYLLLARDKHSIQTKKVILMK